MDDDTTLLERLRPLLFGAAEDLDYFAIRSNKRLRWIIPADRHRLASVLSSWRPYSLKSRLAWRGLVHALAMVGPEDLPLERLGRISEGRADPCILDWAQERALVPIAYVGTPGASRKLVCQFTDESGQVCAIARVPVGTEAAGAIRDDVQAIASLAQSPIGPFIPKLLLNETDAYGLQTVLPGMPGGRRLGPRHVDLLLLLPRTGLISLKSRAEALAARARALVGDTEAVARLAEQWAERIPGDLVVPTVWQHGDFAPWNLRLNGTDLYLLDWEDADAGGLPLWDMGHFHIQQAFLFGQKKNVMVKIRASAEYETYRKAFQISLETGRLLLQTYCLQYGLDQLPKHSNHAHFLLGLFADDAAGLH